MSSEVDVLQRKYFTDLSAWVDNDALYLSDPTCIQIEMPACLLGYLQKVLTDHGENLQYSYVHIDSAGQATASLDYTNSDSRHELQTFLLKEKIPHTVYMNNDEDHWIRADYRYIDGVFKRLFVDYSVTSIDVYRIEECLEKEDISGLRETVAEHNALGSPCPFWEEDIKTAKPLALKATVLG